MSWIISRSGLCLIFPSLSLYDKPAIVESGRSSATSLQVKSNSLRPTQSIAGDAFNVSVGNTIVCAPTKPIFVSGFCDLMASATLQSFFNDGVLVLIMTWSKSLAMARHLATSTSCGGQSSKRELGVSAAGCASHVGYQ